MARVQPVLTDTEAALVDQMAQLTRTKRTDVVKNAIAVYHWFVRQAITGARVVARKPPSRKRVSASVAKRRPHLARPGPHDRLSICELYWNRI